jgi:hypothetical protein
MATTSLADFLREWRTLLVTLEVNVDQLSHLQVERDLLATEIEETEEASIRQKLHKAQFQQATRDLEEHRNGGREAATRIRSSLRGHYGLASEKLAEFGLQPRRFTKSKKAKETPPEAGRTPAQAATPATDDTIQEVTPV